MSGGKVKAEMWRHPWDVVKVVADFSASQVYLPLVIHNLVAGEEVPFPVYLKTRVSGEVPPQYLPCCEKGEVFPPILQEKLLSNGVAYVFIHFQDLDDVVSYLHNRLRQIIQDDNLHPARKVERLYDISLLWLRQFFLDDQTSLRERLRVGLEFVDHLMGCIMQDTHYQAWVLDICRYDSRLYSHCLNTCVLGLAFAKYLGWSPLKIRDFGLGAMLHDIGMTQIPVEILNKSISITPEERELIQKHPMNGYIQLKSCPEVSRDTLATILQHHEHGDGSGYPQGLKLMMIESVGRVMRIVDAYEALTSPRSWRSQFEPVQALWTMRQEWQESAIFDTSYLSAFIKFLARQ